MKELKDRLELLRLKPMSDDVPDAVLEGEVAEMEAALGERLPADYRWFLQHHGNSLFKEAVSCPLATGETMPFMFFYGSNASGNGVLSNYNFRRAEFPRGVLLIGEASFGDLYLLACSGPNRGHVYYWCHDGGGWDEEENDWSCFDCVAPTFSSFILCLTPCLDDDYLK